MRWIVLTVASFLALASAAGCGKRCAKQSGEICTIAGTGAAGLGAEELPAAETELYLPQDLTAGPDGQLYVLDWNNHRIRVLRGDGKMETIIGTGELGDAPDGPALAASLNHPTHIAFAPDGALILSAWHNSKVLRYDFATGDMAGLCGTGKRAFGGDDGPALQAHLDLPVATAFRPDGAMFVADQANARIRLVGTDGVITTVVGTGDHAFGGDDGPASAATLKAPVGQAASPAGKIAVDAAGNLFIADSGNNRVRRVDAQTGVISTFAGSGGTAGVDAAGFGGDGGPANQAQLARPTDVAVGPAGAIYIADTDNSCIRRVDAAGIIQTVAGQCGKPGDDGDGDLAVEALLKRPFGIEVDGAGILYIADTHNHRIRAVYP